MLPGVLIYAPHGRDAQIICDVLAPQHDCLICADFADLLGGLSDEAGLAIVAEEGLHGFDTSALTTWLRNQPSWSDFPFILLATQRAGRRSGEAAARLEQLGNVVILERPFNAETLRKAVASAVRGRQRQHQARRQLDELRRSEERLTASQTELRALNETLETRIAERTAALVAANDRLMREIGERERAQGALIHAQKMEAVGRLTGGIAHDFNNLLAGVAGYVELILRMTSDERVHQMASSARRACNRGARLTAQLLAFSRNQSLQLRPVVVADVLSGMHELLHLSVGSQITVEMNLRIDGVHAVADANQLELAILNLAINARDAMPEGGTLSIEAELRLVDEDESLTPGEYARIAVGDTGHGVPPDIVSKVFDPFFTTKPIGKGTGLGLSQVYGIARQCGGTARIISAEGHGTTMEIWLPVAQPPEREASEIGSAESPVVSRGGRIMVVEDDEEVRGFLVECLRMHGYDVTAAHDGSQAVEKLSQAQPDLLIMDFAMPGMNGADTVVEIRKERPDLPVIFATGYADMRLIEQMDGQAVLRKPFETTELLRSIEMVLRKRPVGRRTEGKPLMH